MESLLVLNAEEIGTISVREITYFVTLKNLFEPQRLRVQMNRFGGIAGGNALENAKSPVPASTHHPQTPHHKPLKLKTNLLSSTIGAHCCLHPRHQRLDPLRIDDALGFFEVLVKFRRQRLQRV